MSWAPQGGCLGVPFSLKGRDPSLMKSLRVLPALLAVIVLAAPATAADSRPRVLAIDFANDVNPVTADYVVGELERAERDGFAAAVIVLDTPGGLSDSMRDIYQKELALKIPVLVYVPTGARAASAGVWISEAADVLGMAPQSNLGSSTPVAVGGGEIPSDLKRKVVNDAAKSLRAISEEHGRNGDWAEQAVRVGSNLTAREALDQKVIDLIEPSLPALLASADGRQTKPKGLTVHTAGAEIVEVHMSLWKRILDTVIDPNIIVLLMSLGFLGITLELYSPGLVLPGTVGVISLVLGLFGLQVLPISAAGVLLMLLALAFFVADLFVTSHGVLTVSGAAAFVFGALILFDPAGPLYNVSLSVALSIAGTIALMTAVALTKVVQARRRPAEVGTQSIVGTTGTARHGGLVFANGELWQAHSAGDEELLPGKEVEIVGVGEGLVLEVRPLAAAPEPSE
jgi:membrane-bound serine protease (ClpP class)